MVASKKDGIWHFLIRDKRSIGLGMVTALRELKYKVAVCIVLLFLLQKYRRQRSGRDRIDKELALSSPRNEFTNIKKHCSTKVPVMLWLYDALKSSLEVYCIRLVFQGFLPYCYCLSLESITNQGSFSHASKWLKSHQQKTCQMWASRCQISFFGIWWDMIGQMWFGI